MQNYINVLKKYAVFSGRASRAEYWMFVLVNIIVSFVLGLADKYLVMPIVGFSVLPFIYSLFILIPGVSVCIRRLHDTNRAGWWIALVLIPIVGFIILLVFLSLPGSIGRNRFGDESKALF